ncbi:hypothetical protein [Actinomadura terrae]|uniref:hypothetical protein n=1 Tax=Actinomadura terrae TaxID=604353 RepID=UPI001FA7F994|nr:hypothetical protein [Actinomadura terrae]
MADQKRPRALIQLVADTSRSRAAEALAEVKELPASDAFPMAFDEVSKHVRTLLEEAGQLPGAVTTIRDAAHKLAYQVHGSGDAGGSKFVVLARKLVRPDG